MNHKKYISFDTWWGGFSNIRMTYELVGAISIITNRTIILPPKIYCLFLSEHHNKNTFFNWWDAFDLKLFKSQFDCVHYEDIPEYALLENDIQYFEGVDKIAKIIMFQDDFKQWGVQREIKNSQVLVCDIIDDIDFKRFADNRDIINLDLPDKFIHFPRNLFGHFYYHVYGSSPLQRNIIRDKIQKGIKYKPSFYAQSYKVKEKIGDYNSIHVRRNDFLSTRPETSTSQIDTLLDDISDRIPNNTPLFIATDEKDKSLFDNLRSKYELYFLDDFYQNLQKYEALILDQIICSESNIFLGSKFSTFSDYINVLRGYTKKLDFHREGTNFKLPPLNYLYFPWEKDGYGWEKVCDSYWKHERSHFNVGIYSSHNSSIAISYKGEVLEVVELERWIDIKNAAFYHHFPVDNANKLVEEIYEYFKNKYNAYVYDNCMHNSCKDNISKFPSFNYEWVPHHVAHIYNVSSHSPANKSLNISFDGGSDEGYFNIYLIENREATKIFSTTQDVCVPYAAVAHYLSPIKQEDNWWWGNLVYPGKLMGLVGYGKVRDEYYPKMLDYFKQQQFDDVNRAHENFQKIFQVTPSNRFNTEDSYDLAATCQKVFEDIFNEIVQPFIDKYPDYELQFSGGGALNIINNSRYDAFTSPSPDDRGLALGLLASKVKPNLISSAYLGSEPYDELPPHVEYSCKEVVDDLINEKILGLIQGRSENGARALGNRSIICLPKPGMKDKLNNNVKKREYFRPFAPIVRLEDASKYFIFGKNSKWMTHNAIVKKEYKNDLISIVHEDGTARLQTITKEQNPFIYDVLTELNNRGVTPVIINTSFNINGKPILNKYSDALWMKNNTGIDEIITDKYKLI